jgi:glycine cleavage system H protein
MRVDERCRYAKTHEWVRVEGEFALVGLSDYAQQQLSDIVYVEVPEVGASFAQDEVFCVVESVKAASDCYLPVAGEVVAVNEALADAPETVNKAPYGEGWFVKIAIADPAELEALMAPDEYEAFAARALQEQEGGH